jgi:hypothetical protein
VFYNYLVLICGQKKNYKIILFLSRSFMAYRVASFNARLGKIVRWIMFALERRQDLSVWIQWRGVCTGTEIGMASWNVE